MTVGRLEAKLSQSFQSQLKLINCITSNPSFFAKSVTRVKQNQQTNIDVRVLRKALEVRRTKSSLDAGQCANLIFFR